MKALWDRLKTWSASPWILVVIMVMAFGIRLGANAVLMGLWAPPQPGTDDIEYDDF